MNKRLLLRPLFNVVTFACVFATAPTFAEEVSAKSNQSTEERLREMDTNKDGMVSVLEVRAALEARHDKQYDKAALDELVAGASGRSCSTPFAQNFY
ncbi:MAG TPA: hypothetical protein VFS17_10695 [Methylophilaceae bacterium]|nr:hypothetical protein [Methylophilaceae bacterium]